MHLKISKVLLILLLILLFIFKIVFGYLSDYSKASDEALAALQTNQTTNISGEDPIIFKLEQETEKKLVLFIILEEKWTKRLILL